MKPRIVGFGVALAAAATGFLVQHVLGGRGSRSSQGGTVDRVKDAAGKPAQKLEEMKENHGELLSDLGSRVSERLGRSDDASAEDDDDGEDASSGDAVQLDELAEKRREREERRRKRASTG